MKIETQHKATQWTLCYVQYSTYSSYDLFYPLTSLPLTNDIRTIPFFLPLHTFSERALSKDLMKLAVSSCVYIHLLIYLSWKHIQQTDYFTPTISPPHIFSLHLLPHYPLSYFPFAVCYVSYLSSISISPFIMQSHHHIFPLIY